MLPPSQFQISTGRLNELACLQVGDINLPICTNCDSCDRLRGFEHMHSEPYFSKPPTMMFPNQNCCSSFLHYTTCAC